MFTGIKQAHFVGIGGIGMSALAKWMIHEGIHVTGSDVHMSEITKDLSSRGAQIFSGHAVSNLSQQTDIVIHTPAVPDDNVELVEARGRGVRTTTNFELLGEISGSYSTIVVTGTNGKSTTTAMLGLILEEAGYDPTVLVGSLVPGFKDGNLRVGKGRFFVIEGCEYKANMMHLKPEMIVLTNIEEDHLDFYRDLKHIQETFQKFVDKLKGQGMVVHNVRDKGSFPLKFPQGIGYGTDVVTDYFSRDRETKPGSQSASVFRKEDKEVHLGDLDLQLPGSFNIENALAATAAAMELGVPFNTCRRALAEFGGIWRRFERVGVWHGADVVSDYAHHPSGVSGTIEATREFFPGRRIVLCYQPHQHDRTTKLFDDFVQTLSLADHIILTEIYDVAGRNEDHDISSKDLVEAIQKRDTAKDVRYASDLDAAMGELRKLVKAGDVILIMGAGDVDDIARQIIV